MIETKSRVTKLGDTYGRYTVLGVYKEAKARSLFARVQCNCGTPPRYVRIDTLRNGTSVSCGCFQIESVTKHGAWGTPLFGVWRNMISRCTNPKDKRFLRYGGRGIEVCERWLNVHNFISDMLPSYTKGMTIDRKDNDGNYESSNCRWATRKQQNRNYSRNVVLDHDGKRMCIADWADAVGIPYSVIYDRIADWADAVGIPYSVIYDRIRSGWNPARAITTPVKR